jgi:hypothetical protein
MAKVKNNLVTEGLSGKLGKRLVFRQMKDGRTIVVTRPDFTNRVFSKEQLTHQSRFQKAAAFAKIASKTQPLYAELAQATRQPAYNLALSDWFHAPVIHGVIWQGGHIYVDVTDNVQVAKVLIKILDDQGGTQEQGQAVCRKEGIWEYETATQGKVIVEASDLAGNVTKQEAYS